MGGRGRDKDEGKKKNIFERYARFGKYANSEAKEQTQRAGENDARAKVPPVSAKTQNDAFMAGQTSKNAYAGQHATDIFQSRLSPEKHAKIDQKLPDQAKAEVAQVRDVFAKYAPERKQEQNKGQEKQPEKDKGIDR